MIEELPTFQTSRLVVRPRSMDDLEACLAMDRDPEVTRFVAGPWADPAAHRTFVENRIRRSYPSGMGYWSIMAPDFVGWILLAPLDLAGPEIEIGWRIARVARGRGYATEAARCVLDHALNHTSAAANRGRYRSFQRAITRGCSQAWPVAGTSGALCWAYCLAPCRQLRWRQHEWSTIIDRGRERLVAAWIFGRAKSVARQFG
jgi:hypothetical protein